MIPTMVAKRSSKNRLSLPKEAVKASGNAAYQRGNAVREKLATLDLGDKDLAKAVVWSRRAATPAE